MDQTAFTLNLFTKLEDEIMQFPKARVWQLEMEVKYWKQKRAEEREEKEKKIDKLIALQKDHFELTKVAEKIEIMKAKVEQEHIPLINKQILMKKKIHELYMALGKTEDQAWKETFTDLAEWDQLSKHMSKPHIVEEFIKAQEAAGNFGETTKEKRDWAATRSRGVSKWHMMMS